MTVYKSEKSTNSLLPPTGNSCVHALPSKPQAISLTPAFDSDKKKWEKCRHERVSLQNLFNCSWYWTLSLICILPNVKIHENFTFLFLKALNHEI